MGQAIPDRRILNITLEDFADMDRKALIRRYRRQAKTVHPDKGGDEKAFVRLTNAYECL
ncbi:MAG: J domain-containing protein, partial [Deltaproteobacteria bacterium]|nr:J domain-containing protein [Deltaproteobacteria bacterium]